MSTWLNNALNRAESIDDWLHVKRRASIELLRTTAWPTRKTEAWKYTSLQALEQADFNVSAQDTAVAADTIAGLNSIDVIFIDGVLQNTVNTLPAGLSIVPLAQASADQQQWASKCFANAKPAQHLFGLVNDALATAGVLIDVMPAHCIDQPIRIVHIMTPGNEAHCRTLVRIGAAARVSVIEQFVGDVNSFNTGFAEYELAAAAQLQHYRLALQSGASLNVGGSHFNLATRAQLNSTLIGYGSELTRVDIDVRHAGEHAVAKLNGIYLLDGDEHFDLHSTIEHAVPNGTTEENIRGIVGGKARAVFNGRIHIHRDAQKTLAELNNRNLLLSREAEVDTKPELEIYADDVRCAHGATIAEMDKAALYYLRSRGVSLVQAQLMLNFGFINELIEQIPNTRLADWLRIQLRERFVRMNAAAAVAPLNGTMQ